MRSIFMYQTLPLRTILAATGASDITTCHCCHILHWEVLTNSMKGRGGCTKTSQNPGIAKKGEGGSDPCKDFFGGFDVVFRGQHKGKMDPQKVKTFHNKVNVPPQLVNISIKMNFHPKIYCEVCLADFSLIFTFSCVRPLSQS